MTLVFKVRRNEPELVKPSKPTPNEVKSLSDWDDKESLRNWVSHILFYKYSSTVSIMKDPVETIKRALAEALVYYYPFSGRFKEEGPNKRLVVDCTAEGVLFVSADADIRLDEFGMIQPPFPWELMYDKPTTTVCCPIFVMQVTRLACGGFILAFSFNHVMCDMVGVIQFLTAVTELARGALAPSVLPVWRRELLNTSGVKMDLLPPRMPSSKSDVVPSSTPPDNMTYRSFFFGDQELEAIRAHLPQRPGDHFSSFELISVCIFHCRVISLEHHAPKDPVRVAFVVNARSKLIDPPIPSGYYGNVSFSTSIIRPTLSFQNLQYIIDEVKKAKDVVTEDYVRSTIEERVREKQLGVPKVAPTYPSFVISDLSRVGLSCLDFGWGKPVYAGPMDDGKNPNVLMFMIKSTNNEGKEGRLITLYMPKHAMDKFDLTLRTFLGTTSSKL